MVDDPELIEVVELELLELLTRFGFDGEKTPFVRGSAMRAHDHPADPEATRCIRELLAALDAHIPDPERIVDRPFLMPIEKVLSIEGRGTVATGRIEQGRVRVGDAVEIVGLRETQHSVVTQVETFNMLLDEGTAGDNVSCLLRGIARENVRRGQVLAAASSIAPHREFEAEVYVLKKEEGGRHTPFFNGYTPQFFFRTTDVTGVARVVGDADMALPGDGVRLHVALRQPIALVDGARFAIREGGRTVGSGVVTKVMT
jgi:elongation factor Tu